MVDGTGVAAFQREVLAGIAGSVFHDNALKESLGAAVNRFDYKCADIISGLGVIVKNVKFRRQRRYRAVAKIPLVSQESDVLRIVRQYEKSDL